MCLLGGFANQYRWTMHAQKIIYQSSWIYQGSSKFCVFSVLVCIHWLFFLCDFQSTITVQTVSDRTSLVSQSETLNKHEGTEVKMFVSVQVEKPVSGHGTLLEEEIPAGMNINKETILPGIVL